MKILHIDSSILGADSASRQLSNAMIAALQTATTCQVTYYDLAAKPINHLTGDEFMNFGGKTATDATTQQLAECNQQVLHDFLVADMVVIGAPMYNFSIPSQLKAWLDRIMVAGKTFRYSSNGPQGLVNNKKVWIASTRGGAYLDDSPAILLDHQERYLTTLFNFLGVTDIQFIRAEGLANPQTRQQAMQCAQDKIKTIVSRYLQSHRNA